MAGLKGASRNWRVSGPTSWFREIWGVSHGLSGEGMKWKLVE